MTMEMSSSISSSIGELSSSCRTLSDDELRQILHNKPQNFYGQRGDCPYCFIDINKSTSNNKLHMSACPVIHSINKEFYEQQKANKVELKKLRNMKKQVTQSTQTSPPPPTSQPKPPPKTIIFQYNIKSNSMQAYRRYAGKKAVKRIIINL